MNTHNICLHLEVRTLLCGYPLLSVARLLQTEPVHMILCCPDQHFCKFCLCYLPDTPFQTNRHIQIQR